MRLPRDRRKPIPLAWLLILLCAAGCVHVGHDEFRQDVADGDARHLYEPMVMGQEALLARLDRTDMSSLVFALSDTGVERLEGAGAQDLYGDGAHVVFFRTAHESGAGTRWLYLNPRKMRLEPLTPRVAVDSDLVHTTDSGFYIFRAIPARGKMRLAKTARPKLFRLDFAFTEEEDDISCLGHYELTEGRESELAPTPLPRAESLLYLQRDEAKRNRFFLVDFAGNVPTPLFEEQGFDVRHPRILSDGRLVFAANPRGAFGLYEVENIATRLAVWRKAPAPPAGEPQVAQAPLSANDMAPFKYPFPDEEASPQKAVFTTVVEEGVAKPVLLELPSSYDLETLCALTAAHNPAINEKRLLLATVLIETEQPRLTNWPLLNLGIEYQSAEEIFCDLPQIVTGDTLSRDIVRGLLGFAQPLLGFGRAEALTEGAKWRAEVAGDLVEIEINERLGEVAQLYFEAQFMKRQLRLGDQLLAVTAQRLDHYTLLHEKGEGIRLQVLAMEQIMEGLRSEQDFHRSRLQFLKSRLKELCALPKRTGMILAVESFRFEDYDPGSLEEIRDRALLNHPWMKLAADELSEAWYQRRAGSPIRPGATLAGDYDLSRQKFNRIENRSVAGTALTYPVTMLDKRTDETLTWGLSGQIPLAARKAARLHQSRWNAFIGSLHALHDARARTVGTSVEEAFMDLRAARHDYRAKAASLAYYLEKMRVARIHTRIGPPASPIFVARTLDAAGLTVEVARSDVTAPLSSQYEYLQSLAKLNKVEMDLGLRFARLWREMGLASQLAEKAGLWERGEQELVCPSIWLWHTREVIASDGAIRDFIGDLRARKVERVYAYLYSDSRLLSDAKTRERMTIFVNSCRQWDIEVWALLGEPEWLEDVDTGALVTALKRVRRFNDACGPYEPSLAGVKLDLEPYSLPAWTDGGEGRQTLKESYLKLLDAAHYALDASLPLWVDCPVKLWRAENSDFAAAIFDGVEGVTVMDYFNSENGIEKWAKTALENTPKPVEIGLEFSRRAPSSDRVSDWPPASFKAFEKRLVEGCRVYPNFRGLALHDYQGVKDYFGGGDTP